jgi:hypothetical protein
MDFSDLFSNGKSGGPGPWRVDQVARLESIVDRGGADKRARRCLAGAWRAGARASRCSLAAVEGHERRRRGSVTEAKNGGGLSLTRVRRKA